VELMQQWTRIKDLEADADINLALVVDAELFRLDAVVRWLDAADGRIKRSAADEADAAEAFATQAPAGRARTAGPVPPSLPKLRRGTGARR
jgi:hypothetical protein